MTLTILSLEDEADVRDALERDLEHFWDRSGSKSPRTLTTRGPSSTRSSRTGTSSRWCCPTTACPESRAWISSWSS